MADDVKVLREAADVCAQFGKEADGEMAAITPAMARGLSVVCARMADMIEREKPKPTQYANPFTMTSDALQAAEDRGWNEALEMAERLLEAPLRSSPNVRGSIIASLRDIRRQPRS